MNFKNKIKFSLFLIFLIIIFGVVNSVYKSEARKYQWYQFKKYPKNSLDIIYAGNSHSFMGVMPNVIEDLLDLPGYDLGISAEEIKTTYYGLKEMYQTQNPKYIVLETYAIELNMTDIKGYYFGFTDSIKFSPNVLKVVLDLYSLENAHQYFPFVRTHAKIWKSPEYTFDLIKNYYASKDNYELTRFYQTNGFEKNDSQIRISEIENLPQDFPIKITEMDSQTTYYFEKIVDLCNQKGSKLILLTMPGMKNMILKEGVDLDYASIAEKYQLDYIDLPNDSYSIIHYSDYTHLTEFGALKATLDIAQELSKILNLQYSNQLFNQYSQMIVADYNVQKIDGNTYLLELQPEHSNFSSNTVTSLFKLDGQISGSWSKNNNKFYFLEIGSGEYRTKVEIYNPSIDFRISQNVFVEIP